MSNRLQVLIPSELDDRIRKAAQRLRMSKGEWVRRALNEALARQRADGSPGGDPLSRLESLDAPTGDPCAIRRAAGECLKRVPLDRRIRLLGVRVGALSRPGATL